MGLKSFEICLENSAGVFFAGNSIIGVVNLVIENESEQARGKKE
jgi:hypothetical protein